MGKLLGLGDLLFNLLFREYAPREDAARVAVLPPSLALNADVVIFSAVVNMNVYPVLSLPLSSVLVYCLPRPLECTHVYCKSLEVLPIFGRQKGHRNLSHEDAPDDA